MFLCILMIQYLLIHHLIIVWIQQKLLILYENEGGFIQFTGSSSMYIADSLFEHYYVKVLDIYFVNIVQMLKHINSVFNNRLILDGNGDTIFVAEIRTLIIENSQFSNLGIMDEDGLITGEGG